jgi:hypothetical protein
MIRIALIMVVFILLYLGLCAGAAKLTTRSTADFVMILIIGALFTPLMGLVFGLIMCRGEGWSSANLKRDSSQDYVPDCSQYFE